MKFHWVTLLGILLLASTVFAQVTISEIDNPDGSPTLDQGNLQILQRLAVIESKVNSLPTSEQINAQLAENNKSALARDNENLGSLIVIYIICCICSVGLTFGILLWLRSQGKI